MSAHPVLVPTSFLSQPGTSCTPWSPSRFHALLTRTVRCRTLTSDTHSAVSSPNRSPVPTATRSRSAESPATPGDGRELRLGQESQVCLRLLDLRPLRRRAGQRVLRDLAVLGRVGEHAEQQAVVVRLRLGSAWPADQPRLEVALGDQVDPLVEWAVSAVFALNLAAFKVRSRPLYRARWPGEQSTIWSTYFRPTSSTERGAPNARTDSPDRSRTKPAPFTHLRAHLAGERDHVPEALGPGWCPADGHLLDPG